MAFASTTNIVAPSLQDQANQIAIIHNISPEILNNLVQSESAWNPNAVGDHSCSYGLVQINICARKNVTKEEALDPTFALNYAAEAISEGTEDAWTSCSCVKYAYVMTGYSIPLQDADTFYPNAVVPKPGELAVFKYPSGESHIAVITAIGSGYFTIKEANYAPCKEDTRTILLSDPALIGFYKV